MLLRHLAGASALAATAGAFGGFAIVWDFRADWSEAQNPNGVWSLLEGENLLPHVASWQSSLGGWSQPQPGWAESENGNNRLPFFFLSNGSETFVNDFDSGDTVVHSWDPVNGVGNGHAAIRWTAPYRCYVRLSGKVWIGRDIGRAVNVRIRRNSATIATAPVASGDPYSSANPLPLNDGAGPLNILQLEAGDTIDLLFETVGVAGDFVVINDYTIEDRGCPPDLSLDGEVSFPDLNILLGQFSQTGDELQADIDDDGDVDFADLNLVLSAFNLSCPDGR